MPESIPDALKNIIGTKSNKKKNLLVLAKENLPNIQSKFDSLSQEVENRLLQDYFSKFMELVEKFGVSINISERKIEWICTNGRICTTYDIAMDRAGREKISFHEALQKECNSHFKLRIQFHSEIENEEKFKYTALNIGNVGLIHYGRFCFFYDDIIIRKISAIAFIKGNSLDSYVQANDSLDISKLATELSTKDFAPKLTAIKHSNEIISKKADAEWPDDPGRPQHGFDRDRQLRHPRRSAGDCPDQSFLP